MSVTSFPSWLWCDFLYIKSSVEWQAKRQIPIAIKNGDPVNLFLCIPSVFKLFNIIETIVIHNIFSEIHYETKLLWALQFIVQPRAIRVLQFTKESLAAIRFIDFHCGKELAMCSFFMAYLWLYGA